MILQSSAALRVAALGHRPAPSTYSDTQPETDWDRTVLAVMVNLFAGQNSRRRNSNRPFK